ncbi:MAG: hypothetical protein ACOCQN_02375 [Halanaerobiaceae bacterium]
MFGSDEEIIIVSRQQTGDGNLNIISPEKNHYGSTTGQLLAGSYMYYPCYEGSSTVANNNREYKVSIYTGRRVVDPRNLIDSEIDNWALVIGENGEMLRYRGGLLDRFLMPG